jgi:hypothetical protein
MRTSSSNQGTQPRQNDRRSEPRREIDVLMNSYLNGYPYLCRASDISCTGIRLHPMCAGSSATRFIGLQFQLPGCPDILTASGEVVAEPDGALGVRFTRMPAVAKERIRRFLSC